MLQTALAWLVQQFALVSGSDWLLAAGAFALIRASSRLGMWPYALMALPGTLAHELAHFIVAWLLAARPSFPSLVPQRSERGWRLGSVAFRAGMLRSVPIALAPFALAPLALVWAVQLLAPSAWPMAAVHAWIVAALVSASLPSSADMRIALPALAVIAVLAGAALLLWMQAPG